jgi:hypothetical protein
MSFIRYFTLLLVLAYSGSAFAEVSVKGMGKIKYSGWSSPSAADEEKAVSKARKAAISKWASSQGGSFLKNYDMVRAQIESDIESYILSESLILEKNKKSSKTYKVVIKVVIDDVRIKNLVSDSSATSQTSEEDKSYMTFVFVSRRQTSVQSYDEKVYKRADTSAAEEGQEQEEADASGVAYSSGTNKSYSVTTGGSTTLKSDNISYDVASADGINKAMKAVFTTSGFEVVDAAYLEEESEGLLSIENFKEDFRTGNDISAKTRRNAAKGAKLAEVPYLAIGTLDIGVKEIDSATGNVRVNVTVTGEMLSLKKRYPKTVASVGPVLVAGLGPNQSIAESKALKKAANKVAAELVNQLNSKGVM